MAIFRKIHTSFWSDAFVQELTPEQKYFFLYLLTNEKTTQCGIYEISKRQICYDTGYNIDTVAKLLSFFTEARKVMYSDTTNEIALRNWEKYNKSDATTVKTLVNQQLKQVKNTVLIEYIHGNDTPCLTRTSIEQEQAKEEEEKIETKSDVSIPSKKDFLAYVQQRCMGDGLNYEDYKKMAEIKYNAWKENGWKDLKGNAIHNWKGKVVANLQYFKRDPLPKNNTGIVEVPMDTDYTNQKF